MPRVDAIPKLPELLQRKIYKSGQTRGADDDEIYQNRVGRNSTVPIRYSLWKSILNALSGESLTDKVSFFERGFIVLISPSDYFCLSSPKAELASQGLKLGTNTLVYYQHRSDWDSYNPERYQWTPAISRTAPLGGEYVARIHATTASEDGKKIALGFTTTGMKGAGIRVYEYAPKKRIEECRLQLEAIYWLCHNSIEAAVKHGMSLQDAAIRRKQCLADAQSKGLLDFAKLGESRIIDPNHQAICPLCLEPLDAYGFFTRKAQAAGRETFDLTITELNLFHIHELRPGQFNHRPYNLGWGHHLCNVVIGDEGIEHTLHWMQGVLNRNQAFFG